MESGGIKARSRCDLRCVEREEDGLSDKRARTARQISFKGIVHTVKYRGAI